MLRRYEEAERECLKVLDWDPDAGYAHSVLGTVYSKMGRHEEAIAELKLAIELSEGTPEDYAFLGQTYAHAGLRDEAFNILDGLKESATRAYVPPSYFAIIYTALGEKELAFEWLEKAYEVRDYYLCYQILEPTYDSIRNDPRFDALVRRMNLDPDLFPGALSAKTPSGKVMLVVLPFDNLSPDPDQEYFSDGMTEELIARLGRLQPKRLGVIARTTAMNYKGTDKSIRQIANDLGVDYVLEGSVRKASGRVRISVNLVQARDQTQIWTDTREHELADVFAVQGAVAEGVAQALALELLPIEQTRMKTHHPVHPEAYVSYLKGRFHRNRWTDESTYKAINYYKQAIEKDPGYAPAYAGLADAYGVLGANEWLPPHEAYATMREYALKALDIDSTLAEAHLAIADVKDEYEWNWKGAEVAIKRAIELAPNFVKCHIYYASFLTDQGRHNEAIEQSRIALQLDPVSLEANSRLALSYFYARQYDKAIEQSKTTIALYPIHDLPRLVLGFSLARKEMFEQALHEFEEVSRSNLLENDDLLLWSLAIGYAWAGKSDDARKILDDLIDKSKREYVSPYGIARIYAALHENDLAFEWLEKAYEARSPRLRHLKADPKLDPLRSDTRYVELLKKMGFEP
jgi:TolB-like protein/Tfp pilus assembly protein PilF